MQTQQQQQQLDGPDSFLSPSFSSYSTDKLADIADQVTRDHFPPLNDAPIHNDFEFVTFRKAAHGVFFDAPMGPVFPVFNRDLLAEDDTARDSNADEGAIALQFPMSKLLIDDEDHPRDRDPPSSSSSEVDDLETIPPGTYCVWTPNSVKASPSRCKKSNSTGSSSSRKWKLLDLLRRSNSDGKDSFVFLTPSSSMGKKKEAKAEKSKEEWSSGSRESGGKEKAKGSVVVREKNVSAHEAFYVRNRELKKVDKRRSYLPYRQDLVGFCARPNGMGKPFSPF